jgi:hypothetical protein
MPAGNGSPIETNFNAMKTMAVFEFRRTEFAGWPCPSLAPVHPREALRFARFPDGRIEHPN